jgi:hypothetical protein
MKLQLRDQARKTTALLHQAKALHSLFQGGSRKTLSLPLLTSLELGSMM